jgi:hypothetical protein
VHLRDDHDIERHLPVHDPITDGDHLHRHILRAFLVLE